MPPLKVMHSSRICSKTNWILLLSYSKLNLNWKLKLCFGFKYLVAEQKFIKYNFTNIGFILLYWEHVEQLQKNN